MTEVKPLSHEIRTRLPIDFRFRRPNRNLVRGLHCYSHSLCDKLQCPSHRTVRWPGCGSGLSRHTRNSSRPNPPRCRRDGASWIAYASESCPGLEEHQQNLIRKVARDFFSVVVIVILFYLLTPFIVLMPGVGTSLAAAIPLVLAAVVVILLYDAGRLLYEEIAKSVHKVTDKIASMVEESEKSKK